MQFSKEPINDEIMQFLFDIISTDINEETFLNISFILIVSFNWNSILCSAKSRNL